MDDNFCLRGKRQGELKLNAKFTNSKDLMTSYLQEVIIRTFIVIVCNGDIIVM